MASTLHQDPTSSMSPRQHQELRNAASPIGTARDAEAELGKLGSVAKDIKERLRAANRRFDGEVLLPDSVPEATREAVRVEAERVLQDVEIVSRRELAVAIARARSIAGQLESAASEPDLSGVPSGVLSAANQLAPLLASQLSGQPLRVIAQRLRAATIRDDEAELLALAMTVSPLLTTERDADDPDAYLSHDLKGTLRGITSRWRTLALDAAVVGSRTTERDLVDLDRRILAANQERRGDEDPYGYGLD